MSFIFGVISARSACEEGLAYFRPLPGQTAQPARCQYAARYYVWGLMARNIAHKIGAYGLGGALRYVLGQPVS